jgi:hypothetical protein
MVSVRKLKEKSAAAGRAGEAARTSASRAARREEALRGDCGRCDDSLRVEEAQVARRRCGVAGDGALSEWMAGVGALMVVAGFASAWARQTTPFCAYAPVFDGSFSIRKSVLRRSRRATALRFPNALSHPRRSPLEPC